MKINLAISFYEYPGTKYEIKELEGKLIDEVVPILNIEFANKIALKVKPHF